MPAVDTYSTYSAGADGSANFAAPVTPHNTNDLGFVTRELIIGVAGNLAIITAGGSDVILVNVPAGRYAIRVTRVKATGTTAANISALW